MKQISIFLLLLLSAFMVAQQPVLKRDIDKHGIVNFMVFDNKTLSIPFEQAKKLLNDSLKFRTDDDLVLLQETKDKLGFTRQFYEQHYKGIKVEHGLYGVHSKNGKIEYVGGEYKKVKNVNVIPSLSEKQALQKALNYIHANKYKWENPDEEKFIKFFKSNSAATNYPKGELLICKDALKTDSIYRLAYVFDIFAESPFSHKLYSIDAITGDVLNIRDLIFDANCTATAATRYSGTQTITTDSYSNGYRLHETKNGVRIETYNMSRGTIYSNQPNAEFSDNDNNWTAAEYNNANFDNAALDAHWGLERVYDYWNTVMQRNSLNNQGLPLINYVHANLVGMGYGDNDNAFWDGQRMTYGDGQTSFNPTTALDVVAHETGHGIMTFSAGFGNTGENGALNEGFSDIWGAVIEHWAVANDPNKQTWLMGEQLMKNGALCLRSLRNPKAEGYNTATNNIHGGYPDTYQKTNWDSRLNPDPHINSTVLSHWFYLLSQGGSGTNDLSNSYTVFGIGIDNAAKIVYQAENVELRNYPTAGYNIAMTQTIQAATDIYGANSPEVIQVQNTWYAVGLGTQPSQLSISGPSQICDQATYTIDNLATGATVVWSGSSNLALSSASANSAVFTANSNGAGWIQATVNGIALAQFSVWVGGPTVEYIDGPTTVQPGMYNLYYAQPQNTANYSTTYYWHVYPSNTTYTSTGNSIELAFPSGQSTLVVSSENACGYGMDEPELDITATGSGYLTLSPNPSSDLVQVSLDATSTNSTLSTNTYSVKVVDDYGTIVSSCIKKEKKFNIPISSFRNGIYTVIVSDGTNTYQNKLIVKH